MAEAKGPAAQEPYIMIDEQKAAPRVEESQPILPAHRDFWVLVGLIIVLLLMFLMMAGYII